MIREENIYCSVPEESLFYDPDKDIRDKIFNFLSDNAGKFFKARQIAKACDLPMGGTQVEVRKAVTKLLEIENKPIISTAIGFALVDNSNQMFFYAKKLQERLQGLQRRIDKVLEIAGGMR